MLNKFIISCLAGFIYVFLWTTVLHPIKLSVRGKRWHHNAPGAVFGIFIVIPLVFFFFILNFEYLTLKTGLNLGISLVGLTVGTIFEHEIVEKKILKRE
jgi:hypothetical protein